MNKDIFVPVTATSADEGALAHGIALASRLQAHLAVLELVSLPVSAVDPWGLTPEPGMIALYDDLRETGKRNAAKLRTRLEKEGISWEVRLDESLAGDPTRLAAQHALYADFSIVGVPDADQPGARTAYGYFEALLFESGRPVLTVPAKASPPSSSGHVVVAWHPAREAARALNDALPLLASATSVDVVHVAAPGGAARGEGDAGLDISLHLARHGLEVNTVSRPLVADSVALTLLQHCRESGAQLMVAGAYGHTRAREWLLGGATRELLRKSAIPMLFAH
jgi:nucleotide-binding universal stress UspA family protein